MRHGKLKKKKWTSHQVLFLDFHASEIVVKKKIRLGNISGRIMIPWSPSGIACWAKWQSFFFFFVLIKFSWDTPAWIGAGVDAVGRVRAWCRARGAETYCFGKFPKAGIRIVGKGPHPVCSGTSPCALFPTDPLNN